MHPKFRPKYFERSHHIFCIKLEQNKKNKVSFDELKVLADYISHRMDIPVSVQADGETVSLAFFWDVRVLGTLKVLDYSTFTQCKALDMDNYFEVVLKSAVDAKQLFEGTDLRTVPHQILDGIQIEMNT